MTYFKNILLLCTIFIGNTAHAASPLKQFEITRPFGTMEIAGIDISITNSSIMMIIILVLLKQLIMEHLLKEQFQKLMCNHYSKQVYPF